MRITRTVNLINRGRFGQSDEFNQILNDIETGISLVTHPEDNDSFIINPVPKGNGVKPIKTNCVQYLESIGWELEQKYELASSENPGPIDAMLTLEDGKKFAFEWETGNISSTHRAIGKMAVGLINQQIIGGILVLPSRSLYHYLTDRIGNFAEIEPYFPMYRNLNVAEGVLSVIEIEHDGLSDNVPLIPKGTDGRALR